MQLSALISAFVAASLVVAVPFAAPTTEAAPAETQYLPPAIQDAIKLPPDDVIRVKDISPNAPDGDRIIGKSWNVNSTDATDTPLPLAKRAGYKCYGGDVWIPQDNLYRGKNGVCNWLDANSQLSWGGERLLDFSDYQGADGLWHPYYDQHGYRKSVFWWLKSPNTYAWDWNACFNTYYDLIWNCHGDNPDSAGGQVWDSGNGWGADLWFR